MRDKKNKGNGFIEGGVNSTMKEHEEFTEHIKERLMTGTEIGTKLKRIMIRESESTKLQKQSTFQKKV